MHVVDYQHHLLSKCRDSLPQSVSTSSVQGILAKPAETPLTPLEQQLTTSLVRRQLSNSSTNSGVLQARYKLMPHIHDSK